MNSSELLDIIGEAADEHIRSAKQAKRTTLPHWVKRACAIAACLILVCVCMELLLFFKPSDIEPAAQGGSAGHDEGSTFMSYAGPVFPLTFLEECADISATRNIDLNFSHYQKEAQDEETWYKTGITVSDSYQLRNRSDEDVTVQVAYPVVGIFQATQWPTVTLDEQQVAWTLNAGTYAGAPLDTGSQIFNTLNLGSLHSWDGYRDLLADGSYFENAFVRSEPLDQKIIVYKLSDITNNSDHDIATLCMRLKYDPDQTKLLSWGASGISTEGTAELVQKDYLFRAVRQLNGNTAYLGIVGKDITGYDLLAYQGAAFAPGESLENVFATITREEMTIDALLREIARIEYDTYIESEFVSFETYYQAVVNHFRAYSSETGYNLDSLDAAFDELMSNDRIFYLCFDVTIPANSSMELIIDQFKSASFDYYCSDSENEDIYGYDMVTSLGSNIDFQAQTASISNYDAIKIVRQNFGFDPGNGITKVTLDLNEPHYYLEVKEISRFIP